MLRFRTRILAFAATATLLAAVGSLVAARALRPTIATPWACPKEIAPGDFDVLLACGRKLYSQNDEELIIRHFFRDRRGGVFLDVGCAHYKDNSTTYYLEHHLGWSGVAVDALAHYGPDYEKYRPATRFFSYLVTDTSDGVQPFYKIERMYLMSSASKEWAENAEDASAEILLRPTITLNDLLAKAGIAKIDFLSMDIETGEPSALAGFDIQRFGPSLVCIEMTDKTRDKIAQYFDAHGYERIARYDRYDRVNAYFEPIRSRGDAMPQLAR
jgi:hypothetical protein